MTVKNLEVELKKICTSMYIIQYELLTHNCSEESIALIRDAISTLTDILKEN